MRTGKCSAPRSVRRRLAHGPRGCRVPRAEARGQSWSSNPASVGTVVLETAPGDSRVWHLALPLNRLDRPLRDWLAGATPRGREDVPSFGVAVMSHAEITGAALLWRSENPALRLSARTPAAFRLEDIRRLAVQVSRVRFPAPCTVGRPTRSDKQNEISRVPEKGAER